VFAHEQRITGVVRKKPALTLHSEKTDGERVYRGPPCHSVPKERGASKAVGRAILKLLQQRSAIFRTRAALVDRLEGLALSRRGTREIVLRRFGQDEFLVVDDDGGKVFTCCRRWIEPMDNTQFHDTIKTLLAAFGSNDPAQRQDARAKIGALRQRRPTSKANRLV
jgi:hypothetical protein